MKRILISLLVLGAVPLLAQSAFDGTWRVKLDSGQFQGHDTFSLQNGVWHCVTCVPKENIKADGKPHKVAGSPYFDSATVNAPNDNTVEISSTKNGKPAGTNKLTVSDDGKTLTSEFTFVSENGTKGGGTTVSDRVGDVPASGNKVSGTWQQRKLQNASENITVITFKATDDELSMHDGTGDSYTAKFDGKDYPYKGDPGTTSVSLKKIDANTIEETDKRNGKVISVARWSIEPDGKTLKVSVDDKLHNQTANWTAEKQ